MDLRQAISINLDLERLEQGLVEQPPERTVCGGGAVGVGGDVVILGQSRQPLLNVEHGGTEFLLLVPGDIGRDGTIKQVLSQAASPCRQPLLAGGEPGALGAAFGLGCVPFLDEVLTRVTSDMVAERVRRHLATGRWPFDVLLPDHIANEEQAG